MLSVSVKDAPFAIGPALTLTDEPVVEPLMTPFPLIVQLWVTVPPAGSTVEVYVWVVDSQIGVSPVIAQVGFGFTGTVSVHCPGQPSRVMLSVRVNEPLAPAVTLTDEPVVEPLMVPFPVIVQL
jgi:hypothetical protein